MNNNYLCPHCLSYLNVCDYIAFSAEKADGKQGLVLLHQEPGNFESEMHPDFRPKEGELVLFRCPVCHASLTSSKTTNLAHLILRTKDNKDFDIYFSRVKGEKSTYKVEGETIDIFGEHSDTYLDYITLSQMK